jgi:hypothetical protein
MSLGLYYLQNSVVNSFVLRVRGGGRGGREGANAPLHLLKKIPTLGKKKKKLCSKSLGMPPFSISSMGKLAHPLPVATSVFFFGYN